MLFSKLYFSQVKSALIGFVVVLHHQSKSDAANRAHWVSCLIFHCNLVWCWCRWDLSLHVVFLVLLCLCGMGSQKVMSSSFFHFFFLIFLILKEILVTFTLKCSSTFGLQQAQAIINTICQGWPEHCKFLQICPLCKLNPGQ